MKTNLKLTFIAIIAVLGVSNAYGQVFEQHLLADSLNLIEDIAACDLDLDGDVDVLCSELTRIGGWEPSLHTILYWWKNNGDGSFNRYTLADGFKRLQGITPMDFDGDGDIDILLAGGEEYDEFTIMENTGALNFERRLIATDFVRLPNEIKAADLNGDGNLDIVVVFLSLFSFDMYSGGIKVYFQTDPFLFEDTTLVDDGPCGWKDLFLLDFDQNGSVDIIATDEYDFRNEFEFTFGWWSNFDGEFEYNAFPEVGKLANINMVDFNHDGNIDIFSSDFNDDIDSTTFTWMENLDGQGFEHHRLGQYDGVIWSNSAVADYDLDDDLDFVTYGNGLELYKNDGNEQFEPRQIPREGVNFRQVIVADITCNGRLDLIARNEDWNAGGGLIYWFENVDERSAPLPEEVPPTDFALTGAYPNPFNSTTTLRFDVPENGSLDISIYSEDGRLVRELNTHGVQAGQFSWVWDGRNLSGETASSGVYILRVNYAGQSGLTANESLKLVTIK